MSKLLKSLFIIVLIVVISGITFASKSMLYEASKNMPDDSTKVSNINNSGNSGNSTTNNDSAATGNKNTEKPGPSSTQSPTLPINHTISPNATPAPNIPATKLVVIDAGHGGADPGTSDFGMDEKNVTLDIALKLESILKNSGINTYMIRTNDVFIDHRDRIKLANSMNASLYISIHLDWFKDRSVNGTTTYYINNKNLTKGNLTEVEYAQIIQRELIKKLNTNDRRIIERPDLAAVKYATMPSVLVELAFLSNKGNADLLATKDFRQKCAEGLAEGIRISMDKIGQN